MVSSKPFYRSACSLWVLVVSLDFALWGVEGITKQEVDRHLELGIQMLARGQMQDALGHFHDAIDGDPNNYVGYYRRATVYLALGRSRSALKDLDEVVKIKPDFTSARVQRASVLLKIGRLDESYLDAEAILQKDSQNEEANRLFTTIYPLREKIQYAQNSVDSRHYHEAISLLNEIIEDTPWDSSMRELRVTAYLGLGDTMQAISDLRAVTKLTQDNTAAIFRLSKLYYQIGDVSQALSEIRECLKLDPDHQTCFILYKKLKKVHKLVTNAHEYKDTKEYSDCVSSANKLLREESDVLEIRFVAYDMLCQCEGQSGQFANANNACTNALHIREEPRIYCDRGEAHLLNDNFDEAINDFQKALNLDEHYQRARESLDRAKKLKKQASKKDYYKILGVKRTATKREITKAYRSLAQKWHPDHYDGDEKKKAEAKFIDIAAAKEVLTDPEKRAKFDNGEDPLDPEQQANQGFNPFHHPNFAFRHGGGFPGGFADDGPFHFKFNFN